MPSRIIPQNPIILLMNEPIPHSPSPSAKVNTCSCGVPLLGFRITRKFCLECAKVRGRKATANWYSKNRDKVAAYDSARYEIKKDYYSEQSKRYHAANKDEINARRKRWESENKDYLKEYGIAYNKTPAGKARAANGRHKRRAKMKGSGIPSAVIVQMMDDSSECPYCKSCYDSGRKKKSLDHKIPISKGGEHVLENLLICCLSCNHKKRTRTAEQWIEIVSNQQKSARPLPEPDA